MIKYHCSINKKTTLCGKKITKEMFCLKEPLEFLDFWKDLKCKKCLQVYLKKYDSITSLE